MSSNADKETKKSERCPICDKPAIEDYAPFCSKRCADVDLHRWLSGSYAIPAVEDDGDAEDGEDDDA
jgi:hypothetical protein